MPLLHPKHMPPPTWFQDQGLVKLGCQLVYAVSAKRSGWQGCLLGALCLWMLLGAMGGRCPWLRDWNNSAAAAWRRQSLGTRLSCCSGWSAFPGGARARRSSSLSCASGKVRPHIPVLEWQNEQRHLIALHGMALGQRALIPAWGKLESCSLVKCLGYIPIMTTSIAAP